MICISGNKDHMEENRKEKGGRGSSCITLLLCRGRVSFLFIDLCGSGICRLGVANWTGLRSGLEG